MLPQGIELEQAGPLVTVRLGVSEVTHMQMQETISECAELMRYSNAQHFIFDLGPVEFLASACLGVLVGFMQDVEHVRGKIALAGCRDNVAFLFKVTRLDQVLGLYDDPAEAAATF